MAILVVNQIYGYVAVWLTEIELNRTQTEFDDSLSLKIYLLQFVNYYASIFYIAFFKVISFCTINMNWTFTISHMKSRYEILLNVYENIAYKINSSVEPT